MSDLILPGDNTGGALGPYERPSLNPAARYLASLSPGSRRTMRESLNIIARFLGADYLTDPAGMEITALYAPWHELRYEHTLGVRAWLAEHYAPNTANKMLAAMRGVLREAWRLDLMTADEYQRAIDLKTVPGSALRGGRLVSDGELAALMASCQADRTPAGYRDAAMIAVMYLGGLRRGSVTGLDVADYDPATGDLQVRQAKGRKVYTAHLADPSGQAAVEDWLAVRGLEPGPLFVPVNKAGRLGRRRMTETALYKMLQRRAEQAGIEPFSPHDLRRKMATDLLDAGADMGLVKRLMNHSRMETTERYDHRPEQAKRRAAGLLHLPYRRKK